MMMLMFLASSALHVYDDDDDNDDGDDDEDFYEDGTFWKMFCLKYFFQNLAKHISLKMLFIYFM